MLLSSIKNIDWKMWFSASRPESLVISISSVIPGIAIAYAYTNYETGLHFHPLVATLTIIVAVLLQVLSNYSNDYADFINGTDDHDRIGYKRPIHTGLIAPVQFLQGIKILALVTFLLGCLLVFFAFDDWFIMLMWIIIGVSCILAAVTYTLKLMEQELPYGYKYGGDIACFTFFGLVSVYGSFYLQTNIFNPYVFLAACATGFSIVSVLNLNNMRDIVTDVKAGKLTVVQVLGFKNAKLYHYFLIIAQFVFYALFNIVAGFYYNWLFLVTIYWSYKLLIFVRTAENELPLDTQLGPTSLTVSATNLLFAIGIIFS